MTIMRVAGFGSLHCWFKRNECSRTASTLQVSTPKLKRRTVLRLIRTSCMFASSFANPW